MTCTFHAELTSNRQDIEASRRDLLAVVDALSDTDFERGRRGGWTVRRVLEHVIHSERLYTQAIAFLNSRPANVVAEDSPTSASDAHRQLEASRARIIGALEGTTEDTFYTIRTLGHDEYSILSVLENTSAHDHEHAAQIRAILAG